LCYLHSRFYVFFFSSCDSPGNVGAANAVTILNLVKEPANGSVIYVKLELKNNGNFRLQPVARLKLKKGNTIVGSSFMIYSIMDPGENETKRTFFMDVKSHQEYDTIHVEVTWDDDEFSYTTSRSF
jgi:hypothetical protein